MLALPALAEATALQHPAVAALSADERRIVVVGAGGWVGRAFLRGLHEALGKAAFGERVVSFGSSTRAVDLGDSITLTQRPLGTLADLPPQPSAVFHLAFLTKDKVAGMDLDAYRTANRELSGTVYHALNAIGADRLFVASSGAAAFADDPDASEDLRVYGALKREDEDRFANWAMADGGRRAVITRIYSLSGPFINKHETYALASFISDALAARPIAVRAPMRVVRSYVGIRELMSLVIVQLLGDEGRQVHRFDSGGQPLELGEVAAEVARVLGGSVERAPITVPRDNVYAGSAETYAALLGVAGIAQLSLERQIAETATTLQELQVLG
jgi:UDP-glucuronate decarboxylase